jgi:hypothetical protein
MAQSGFTPISIYYSATSTNVPTAGNLVAGELAINTADGKLFYKDSAGVVQVIGTKGGVGSSTTTQVLYNSSGLVVGSANMTYDGTKLTLANDASISGLTVGKGGGAVGTNTTVGANTLTANTTGARNTAIGGGAGASNTTGNGLTALGYNTLANNTTGSGNIAIGGSDVSVGGAMQANTTGGNNTAVGTAALGSNTTASNNTAVGYQAKYSNTTGVQNISIGMQSGYTATAANNCVYVGYQSGYSASDTGDVQNTFVGYSSGYSNTTGYNNTFYGGTAGYYVTTGSKNTIIGRYTGNQGGLDIRTSSNYIVLSDGDGHPFIYGQYGATSYVSNYFMASGAGTHYMKWNSSTYAWTIDTSSRLIKENIIDSPYGLEEILQLQPRKYFRTDDQKEEIGFIADEVASVIPEIVPTIKKSFFTKKEEDVELIPSGVDYARLTPILVKAIQELKAEFDAYKTTHP